MSATREDSGKSGDVSTLGSSRVVDRLQRWSEIHAAILLALILLALASDWSFRSVGAAAIVSLCSVSVICWGQWTPGGSFGVANAITILRFIGTLPFFFALKWNDEILAGLALTILCADGIDGWVARRCGQASDFGETLDREVDALFFLGLCCLLYAQSKLGFWVLLPGSLRYLFVVFVGLAGPPRGLVKSTRLTRSVAVVVMLTFTLCLLPVDPFRLPLAALASLGLIGSFLSSLWHLYHPVNGSKP